MRIAIVYATKSGTTAECAARLAEELKNYTPKLFEIGVEEPDLSEFDTVILGFSIRMGKALKKARRYMQVHADQLEKKSVAYFICCGFVDCFEEYAEKCIPKNLRERAVDVACLGGSLDPKRVKGFDRIVVKAVRNEILGGGDNADQRKDMVLPTVMPENISQLAAKIRDL